MSTPVSLGFSIGVLAALASCVLPFAAAAIGLSAAAPGSSLGGHREAIHAALATGAVAGLAFCAVVLVAFALEEAGIEISDGVPVIALVAAIAVAVVAIRVLRSEAEDGHDRRRVAALFGAGYGIVALPGSLWMIQGAVELTAESRGAAGAVASVVLFGAGAFAVALVIALLAELCAAGARRTGMAGRVLGAAVAIGAAIVSALYWLPAVADGVGERGGATGDAIADVAGEVGWFAASYGILFAAVLLAAAAVALLTELRRPART